MCAVMNFHSYSFGHHFKLRTDHKSLLHSSVEAKQFASSVRQDPMLGTDPGIIQIHNCVLKDETTCKCRCYEQVATA